MAHRLSKRRLGVVALLLWALVLGVAIIGPGPRNARGAAEAPIGVGVSPAGGTMQPAPDPRPNIIFVLTDDLSLNLLQYMPHVLQMQREGTSFRNYFVSDSLCCPSRSSILTGSLPHNTGIYSNVGQDGGFHLFHELGEEQQTFATRLKRAGYRTGFMGKYLNGYMTPDSGGVPPTYVPPGWSDWVGAGDAYSEFNYTLNENGVLHNHGRRPADYLTDVLAAKGVGFIDGAVADPRPFLLELSTFAPHSPFTPAPRHADFLPDVRAPRPPNFDAIPRRAPRWLAGHQPLSSEQVQRVDKIFRKRARSVLAVDEMIGQLQAALAAHDLAQNTYVVFSSDNGFHTGQYRLTAGKLTAYDPDIRVPLVVTGPGVPVGGAVNRMTENIDLASTFSELGGAKPLGDGRSLVPFLKGSTVGDWRDAVLVEHHGPRFSTADPDAQLAPSGNPTTYAAMRTPQALYVEYRGGEREYYDLVHDRYELHNLAPLLSDGVRARLHSALRRMQDCRGIQRCWAAMHTGSP